MRILLDTHIILFANSGKLEPRRLDLLEDTKNSLFVSQISLWEIAKLYELRRIRPERSLEHLLMSIYYHPRFQLIDFNPAVLLKLPVVAKKMNKDPADQIIVASALSSDASVMTNDRSIIASKLVQIV